MENLVMSIVTVAWVILCIISWMAQSVLYKRIKKDHYQKWVDIGEPGFSTMISNDISKFKKANLTFRYFLKGDFELDADKRINSIKKVNQGIFLIAIAVFIFIVIFSVISSVIF